MRIATFDLGSNSFHLLIAEAGPNQTFVPITTDKEMLSLGAAVAEHDGIIPDELLARALDTVRRFRRLADAGGAQEIRAVATSAFRIAQNADVLLDRIASECGVEVEVISGHREAELVFGAVRAAVVLQPAPALCADLGGGSLELIVGDATGARWLTSLPLGVGRLTAQYVHEDPLSKKERRRLHDAIRKILDPVINEVAEFAPRMLVGSSGTFQAIAAMCAARRFGSVPMRLNQFRFTQAEFHEVAQSVLALDAEGRRSVMGLDARRVPVIAAGLLVCGALFDATGIDAMTISEWALREGVLLDAITHHDPVDWSDDPHAIRRASVEALARRCSSPEAHAHHVGTIALRLFDETVDVHGLGAQDRELLEYAAILHDIGEHVAPEGHHRHGAYLVMHGALRGFDHKEISMLAAIVRWHRRGEPKATDDLYDPLDADGLARVRALTAMLQLADGLDRGRGSVLRGLTLIVDEDRAHLQVQVVHGEDGELEVWGARRKKGQFEKLIGRPVDIVVS
ncbi:MAG: HD domain-containing protein [Acidimicrobiia bacterium]